MYMYWLVYISGFMKTMLLSAECSACYFSKKIHTLSVIPSHAVFHCTAYSPTLLGCCWLATVVKPAQQGQLKACPVKKITSFLVKNASLCDPPLGCGPQDPAQYQLVHVVSTLGSLPLPSLAEVCLGFSSAAKDQQKCSAPILTPFSQIETMQIFSLVS